MLTSTPSESRSANLQSVAHVFAIGLGWFAAAMAALPAVLFVASTIGWLCGFSEGQTERWIVWQFHHRTAKYRQIRALPVSKLGLGWSVGCDRHDVIWSFMSPLGFFDCYPVSVLEEMFGDQFRVQQRAYRLGPDFWPEWWQLGRTHPTMAAMQQCLSAGEAKRASLQQKAAKLPADLRKIVEARRPAM